MLIAEALELPAKFLGVGCGQGLEAINTNVLEHFAPFCANPTHLTEMPFLRRNLIAQPPPATERALAAICRQSGRIGSVEVGRQSQQRIIELTIQAASKRKTLTLQSSSRACHRKAIRHRPTLKFHQQASSQGELQAMLSG
jgi:hypothetical protein